METIKLDLIPGKKMPSLHASQFDDGRAYHIDLTEKNEPYKLDGTEVLTVNERKGDNNICSLDIENTFADKTYVEFASTLQMCACAGSNFCELRISKGGVDIGTLNFILEVEPDPTADGIESESEIRNLKTQVEAITEEVIGEDYYTKTQTDDAIATAIDGKADTTYVNEELAKKADKTDLQALSGVVDTKANTSDVNNALALKADKSTTYTKSEVDTALSAKADKSDTYTKSQVDASLNAKMDKTNPTGSGYFSLNRKANTAIGNYSCAEGYNNEASGNYSHAENVNNVASGNYSHVEGYQNVASGINSHAEGYQTEASGNYSRSAGANAIASGNYSSASGNQTIANHKSQTAIGEYNLADDSTAAASSRGKYVEIVGNGTSNNNRSNARTLAWDGTETIAGDLVFGGSTSLTGEISRLDGRIDDKADKSNTYTQEQVNNIVSDAIYNILPSELTPTGAIASFSTTLELPVKYEVENTASVVTRCGANLWNEEWEVGAIDNATGQDIINPNAYRTKGYIKVPLGESLYMCNDNAYTIGCRFYDADKNFLSSRAFLTSKVMVRGTNDLPTNAAFIRFTNVSSNIYANDIGINFPQTETTYAHYNGNEYPISDLSNLPVITALNGVNNLFADSGDVSAEYKVSIEQYVSDHSGGGLGGGLLGGGLGGAKNGGSEEEPTEESEETKKTKEIDEPKEEIKTIGDEPISKK